MYLLMSGTVEVIMNPKTNYFVNSSALDWGPHIKSKNRFEAREGFSFLYMTAGHFGIWFLCYLTYAGLLSYKLNTYFAI